MKMDFKPQIGFVNRDTWAFIGGNYSMSGINSIPDDIYIDCPVVDTRACVSQVLLRELIAKHIPRGLAPHGVRDIEVFLEELTKIGCEVHVPILVEDSILA